MKRWVFNEDGWTDWQQHDGKGCPCVGWWVEFEAGEPDLGQVKMSGTLTPARGTRGWVNSDYRNRNTYVVIRYRVRKPKGAEMLERLAQDVPEPVDA
jgi:hypothetical protein